MMGSNTNSDQLWMLAPGAAEEGLTVSDAEFDALLAASSVGTPASLERQAQTPSSVLAKFDDDLERRFGDGSRSASVDDFVLDLVHTLHFVQPTIVAEGHGGQSKSHALAKIPSLDLSWADPDMVLSHHAIRTLFTGDRDTGVYWVAHQDWEVEYRSTRVLQSLIEFDAVAGIRPEVAVGIVHSALSMSQPPWIIVRTCMTILDEQEGMGDLLFDWLEEPVTSWPGDGRFVESPIWIERPTQSLQGGAPRIHAHTTLDWPTGPQPRALNNLPGLLSHRLPAMLVAPPTPLMVTAAPQTTAQRTSEQVHKHRVLSTQPRDLGGSRRYPPVGRPRRKISYPQIRHSLASHPPSVSQRGDLPDPASAPGAMAATVFGALAAASLCAIASFATVPLICLLVVAFSAWRWRVSGPLTIAVFAAFVARRWRSGRRRAEATSAKSH